MDDRFQDIRPSPRSARRRAWLLWSITLGIVIPGGYGFIEKFIQFVRTLQTDTGGGFTIIPIANYLTVTAGFICLLIWGARHGMFHDVEKPKYAMMERERMINQADASEQDGIL